MVLSILFLLTSTMKLLVTMHGSLIILIFYDLVFFEGSFITAAEGSLLAIRCLWVTRVVAYFLFYVLCLQYHLYARKKEENQHSFKILTTRNSTNQLRIQAHVLYQKLLVVENKPFQPNPYWTWWKVTCIKHRDQNQQVWYILSHLTRYSKALGYFN